MGFSPIIYKYFLRKLDFRTVVVITGLVVFFSSLLLYAMYPDVISRDISRASMRDILLLVLLIVVTFFIANIMSMYILRDNKAYAVSAVAATAPILTLFLSIFLFKEQVGLQGILGVALASAGVLAIVLNDTSPK